MFIVLHPHSKLQKTKTKQFFKRNITFFFEIALLKTIIKRRLSDHIFVHTVFDIGTEQNRT